MFTISFGKRIGFVRYSSSQERNQGADNETNDPPLISSPCLAVGIGANSQISDPRFEDLPGCSPGFDRTPVEAERATMTGTMRAFEVYLNGKRLCVAGIGDDGVLNTMVDHVVGHGRNELYLRVGGLISPAMEHLLWKNQRLKTGDEVRVRIIESASIDRPKERHRRDPKQELKAQKKYVREMARKLGWKLTTSR